jgi:Skp family chaperone for outer membrane proteins
MDKKWTKWLIPAVLIVVLALVISGLVGAQSKATVGYIDMQRLQHELPQFQELQELLNSKNAEFNSFGNYLQTQQKNELAQLEKEKNAEIKGKSQEEIKRSWKQKMPGFQGKSSPSMMRSLPRSRKC